MSNTKALTTAQPLVLDVWPPMESRRTTMSSHEALLQELSSTTPAPSLPSAWHLKIDDPVTSMAYLTELDMNLRPSMMLPKLPQLIDIDSLARALRLEEEYRPKVKIEEPTPSEYYNLLNRKQDHFVFKAKNLRAREVASTEAPIVLDNLIEESFDECIVSFPLEMVQWPWNQVYLWPYHIRCFLDWTLDGLHFLVIYGNLLGWLDSVPNPFFIWVLGSTLLSWFVIGPLHGTFGWCFLTEYSWIVKSSLGYCNLPPTFIAYKTVEWFGPKIHGSNKERLFKCILGIMITVSTVNTIKLIISKLKKRFLTDKLSRTYSHTTTTANMAREETYAREEPKTTKRQLMRQSFRIRFEDLEFDVLKDDITTVVYQNHEPSPSSSSFISSSPTSSSLEMQPTTTDNAIRLPHNLFASVNSNSNLIDAVRHVIDVVEEDSIGEECKRHDLFYSRQHVLRDLQPDEIANDTATENSQNSEQS